MLTTVKLRRAYRGRIPGQTIEVEEAEAERLQRHGFAVVTKSCPFSDAPYFREEWYEALKAAGFGTVAELADAAPEDVDSVIAPHIGPKRAKDLVKWAQAHA